MKKYILIMMFVLCITLVSGIRLESPQFCAGGVCNGNLLVNGNFTVIGGYMNATVVNSILTGHYYPGLTDMFDIGSNSLTWNHIYGNYFHGDGADLINIDVANIPNLNATIDARDDDTTYNSDEIYINEILNKFYFNETILNNSVLGLINASSLNGSNIYGINSSDYWDSLDTPSDIFFADLSSSSYTLNAGDVLSFGAIGTQIDNLATIQIINSIVDSGNVDVLLIDDGVGNTRTLIADNGGAMIQFSDFGNVDLFDNDITTTGNYSGDWVNAKINYSDVQNHPTYDLLTNNSVINLINESSLNGSNFYNIDVANIPNLNNTIIAVTPSTDLTNVAWVNDSNIFTESQLIQGNIYINGSSADFVVDTNTPSIGFGVGNDGYDTYLAICFGEGNICKGDAPVITGGYNNEAWEYNNFIGNGYLNNVTNTYSTIVNGEENKCFADYCFIGNGLKNVCGSTGCVIGGGSNNMIEYNPVGGEGDYAFIGGGLGNNITKLGKYGVIGGGYYNTVNERYCNILGGDSNRCLSYFGSIMGGNDNEVDGQSSTIISGDGNLINAYLGAIVSGENCKVTSNYANAMSCVNSMVGGFGSSMFTGYYSEITGDYSVGGGYRINITGDNTFAFGRNSSMFTITKDNAIVFYHENQSTTMCVGCINPTHAIETPNNISGNWIFGKLNYSNIENFPELSGLYVNITGDTWQGDMNANNQMLYGLNNITLAQTKSIIFDSTDTRIFATDDLIEDLYLEADDDVVFKPDDEVQFHTNGDTTDFLVISTAKNVPRISTEGECSLSIEPEGDLYLSPIGDDVFIGKATENIDLTVNDGSVCIGSGGCMPGAAEGTLILDYFPSIGSDPMCWDGSGASMVGDCTSLKSLKKDIKDFNFNWDKYMNLNVRTFKWDYNITLANNTIIKTNNLDEYIGFVAEEVEQAYPKLAKYRDGNLSGYHEFGMTALNTEAIQELKKENLILKLELCKKDKTYSWCK